MTPSRTLVMRFRGSLPRSVRTVIALWQAGGTSPIYSARRSLKCAEKSDLRLNRLDIRVHTEQP
jgi:hypothetical protein